MPPTSQAHAQASLWLVQSRRATYHKSRKGQQRALNWPFPLTGHAANASTVHPDRLADCGLYSTPTLDSPTCSTCFACSAVIAQLQDGDDPVEKHLQALDASTGEPAVCGWLTLKRIQHSWPEGVIDAITRDGDSSDWAAILGDEWRQPHSKRLNEARSHTFEYGWPHEGQTGIPSKQEIAAAGWFFRPGPGDAVDNCLCPFCTRTVEGWEAGDDPVALHQRKLGLKCPFFVLANDEEPASAEHPAPKLSRSKARTKLTDVVSETDAIETVTEPAKPTRASRRAASKVPSSPAANVSAAPSKPTRATRQSKRTTAAAQSTEVLVIEDSVLLTGAPNIDDAEEDEIPVANESDTVAEASRPRRGARVGKVSTSSVVTEISTKSKKSRRKTAQTIASQEVSEPVDDPPEAQEAEPDAAEVEAKPVRGKKKTAATKKSANTAKSKQKALVESELDDAESPMIETPEVDNVDTQAGSEAESIQPPAKVKSNTSSTKSKAKSSSKGGSRPKSKKTATPILVDADADADHSLTQANGSSSDKSGERPPLTPTDATNVPGLSARGAPSDKPNDVFSTKPDPLVEPYVSKTDTSTLFPIESLDALTADQLDMTISQFYNHIGRQTYEALDKALQAEYDAFENRVQQGRERLLDMVRIARQQELA
ncbi:hypothetical protein OIV83_005533 [Microbotryomycetes sp. JL201]|nr:hypothetical protein OIV83_005533 [Microbotryomycetes sp. JL201]